MGKRASLRTSVAVDDELCIDYELYSKLRRAALRSHLKGVHVQFVDKLGRRRLLHQDTVMDNKLHGSAHVINACGIIIGYVEPLSLWDSRSSATASSAEGSPASAFAQCLRSV